MPQRSNTRKSEPVKNSSKPSLVAMEDVAKSFFRKADRARAKQLGRPFKDQYPRREE